jgi:hypothetical protein
MIIPALLGSALGKAWAWWKKWWKWVLFPIGLLSFLVVGRKVAEEWRPEYVPPPPAADKTVVEVRNALIERDVKLDELKEQHAARLKELSRRQQKELEELEAKPLEEVVQWFDKLSS